MKRLLVITGVVALLAVAWGTSTTASQGMGHGRSGTFAPGTMMMPRATFAPHRVKVFFTRESSMDDDCSATKRFYRRTTGVDVLHDSIAQLMRGPRPSERRDGVASLFSHRTAGLLNSVRVSDGTAYIDFDDLRGVVPGASASCGGKSLLSELKRTAKQFPTVDRVVFSLEGSKAAFYNWLQMETPGR